MDKFYLSKSKYFRLNLFLLYLRLIFHFSLNRHRGRNLSTPPPETTTEDVAERLPSNTRFPPRSRGSAAAATTTPAATPSSVSRTRSGSSGGSVRRPSLELVDSQSFRTHSSSSGEPDQPSFPSVLPAGL